MPKVFLSREDAVDYDDEQAQVALVNGTTANVVLSLTTKNALDCYLAFVGMAWDVAIDTFTTWRIKKDGIIIRQLKDSKVQIAAPEQPTQELVPWIKLPQQCTITGEMDLVGASGNGNGTFRFRTYYFMPGSGLYLPG